MAPYTLPTPSVILITGCSTGLGAALASHLLTTTQHLVAATARNPDTLLSLPSSPNALLLPLDVTSESSLQTAVTEVLKKWGRIDVLVNNAGYGMRAHTELVDLTSARSLMDANFWGAVRLTQLIIPIMRSNANPRGGLVIQMSSLGGRMAFAGGAFYSASKFALEGFTESLSKELPEEWGIHFLLAEPGGVKTNYVATSERVAVEAQGDDPELGKLYEDPGLPANVLKAYTADPNMTARWARPETVARVLWDVVERGGELPFRLPLGSDAHGLIVQTTEAALKELERVKDISCSTSGEAQLASLDFLSEQVK